MRPRQKRSARSTEPTSRAGEYVISVALAAVGGTKCILVLASDGLWSHLSAIQVMAIVAEELIGVQEGALARPLPRPGRPFLYIFPSRPSPLYSQTALEFVPSALDVQLGDSRMPPRAS